ncbi:MAG: hypothetical protein LBU95_04375, partial [Rikenellaceae bacterium]|jgi:methyl-accepting chemotaxis protein|nr:hypothetical protein [Rikenellaceae bacterium]
MHGDVNLDSVYSATQMRIDVALTQATVTVRDRTEMDNIYDAREDYELMMADFFAGGAVITREWFNDSFQENYFRLNSEIKDYMISAQESLRDRSSHLGDTAYRAIMPGILALAVGIVILLIFLFLTDQYLTKPVTAINRALRGYLTNRIPFQVKMEGKDEVFQIKEGIEDLIAQYKRKTE